MLVALEHSQLHLGAILIVQIVLAEAHVEHLAHTVRGGQDPERRDQGAAAKGLLEPIEDCHLPGPLALACRLAANDFQQVVHVAVASAHQATLQLQRSVLRSSVAPAAHDDTNIVSTQCSGARLRVHAPHGCHWTRSGLIGGHLLDLGLQPLLAEAVLRVAVGDLPQHLPTALLANATLSAKDF